MSTITHARSAHPYRDTAVIDARAPRTNQAIVGTLSLLALLTGWWGILAARMRSSWSSLIRSAPTAASSSARFAPPAAPS